jgi:hypothetical protein
MSAKLAMATKKRQKKALASLVSFATTRVDPSRDSLTPQLT